MAEGETDYSRVAQVARDLGLHEHLCLIYETREQQFAAALPYLRSGLERGEKCLYVVDENTAAAVLDGLRKGGVDVDKYLRSGALTVTDKRETYLKEGRFDPDRMIAFLAQSFAEAGAGGFPALRTMLGEMTWVLGTTNGTDQLIEYESKLNFFVRDHDTRLICQYNRARFSPEFIMHIIRAHPLVVYGGLVCKNPYYIPPEEFLKPNQASQEVERLLRNILRWQRVEQALRLSQEALKQGKDRLRLVLDTTPALIHSSRPDGYLDYFNQRWLEYVGLPLEQLQGRGWKTAIHPEDVDRIVDRWHTALASGEPFSAEARLRRADGQYRWMLLRKVPLRNEHGNIVKWYGTATDIEDLKRAEDRVRLIIDTIPTMAWSVRPDGIVDFLSQRWLDYSGLSLEQYVQNPMGPIHPEDVPKVMEKWSESMAAGEPYEAEMRLRRADGEYRWFLVRTAPLRDEHGNIVKWYGSSVDIDDHKRAEEELRRSEAYLTEGQKLSHTGSWALNLLSGDLYWSKETYRIFGCDQPKSASNIDETFLNRVHPEDRPRIEHDINRATIQKTPYQTDYRIVLPDGSIRYIHEVVHPVTNEAGEVIERYGLAMDVTERKLAEEELRQSEDRIRAILEFSPNWIFLKDTEGRYLLVNREVERVFRVSQEQFKGKTDSEIFPPERAAEYRANDLKVLREGRSVEFEEIADLEDGPHTSIVHKFPLFDSHGNIYATGGVATDITERKQAERELQRLSGQLLRSEDEERRRIARELHDSTGQELVALATMLGQLQAALSPQERKAHRLLSEMQVLADHCLREIRTFSYVLHPPALDQAGLGDAIRDYTAGFTKRSGIDVELELPEHLERMAQDVELALFRIVQEALTNIQRHSGSRQAKIRIHRNAALTLEISDRGHGMSGASGGSEKRSLHVGVGIRSMEERAKLIGGRLEIDSTGQGTTVRVTVPLEEYSREATSHSTR